MYPHLEVFKELMCPHSREFAILFQFFLKANAWVGGGGGGGGGWALMELTDALMHFSKVPVT